MKYEVIIHYDLTSLEFLVNSKLSRGWKLQGGISLGWDRADNCMNYAQALVRDE
jgi:hypothetical protein